MKEYAMESKSDALKVVFGDKFYDFMFNDVSDVLSQKKIQELGDVINKKENRLALLNAGKLNILYNTLYFAKTSTEKKAYNEVLKAIDIKVEAFVKGREGLEGDCIDPMISLLQKRIKKADTLSNPELYNMALNKAILVGKKYDIENGLSDITKDNIGLIDVNLKRMSEWQTDVTDLNDDSENMLINIPEDKFLEFVQKRIYGKNDVSFVDLHSIFVAINRYKKSDNIREPIIKLAEAKIKKFLSSKDVISQNEIISAEFVYEEIRKYDKNIAQRIKGFDKKISQSIQKYKDLKIFETISQIVQNTEVTGAPKFLGRKSIVQLDKNGRLRKGSDIAVWLESVKNKTICQLITADKLTKEKFNQTFVDNVVGEYMTMVSVNDLLDNKYSKGDLKRLFADIGKGKKVKLSQGVIVGNVANSVNDFDNFVSRLSSKLGKVVFGIDNMKEKANKKAISGKIVDMLMKFGLSLDEKCIAKWGEKYAMVKGFAKAIGKQSAWAVAFNVAKVAGVAYGLSWILPAVAALSFANMIYQFGNDYIQAKNTAKKKNKKLNFVTYCSKNKVRLASLALSASVAVATVGTTGSGSFFSNLILGSKTWVSGGIVACKVVDNIAEDKKNNKGWLRVFIRACLTMIISSVGYLISRGVGEKAFDASRDFIDTSVHDNIDNGVSSTFGVGSKNKSKNKAIKIVPLRFLLHKNKDNEKVNAVQVALSKGNNLR